MIKAIDKLIQKYDAATTFVVLASAVVVVELSLMRILVPSTASANNLESGLLMEQAYSWENVLETSEKLDAWSGESMQCIDRLTARPETWQKELQTTIAFGFEREIRQELHAQGDSVKEQNAAANFAAGHLDLQSIMTGRKTLANINGSIYIMGDKISIRDGEIVMVVSELGSDFATLHLDKCPDIKRTIYLSRDMRLATGDRLP